MELEIESWWREHPHKFLLKVSSWSNIRNLVKTLPVHQVSYRSLLGQGGSWWRLRWSQVGENIHKNLDWKFNQDSTSGTLSRLYPSTKSLHGVLEDREVPDGAGDGVRVERTSIQIFAESFLKIQHQEPCQDSTRPPSLFMESCRTGRFLMELEL